MIDCYLALGSNLSAPMVQIRSAIHAFSMMKGCQLLAQSSLYITKPLGPQDQDNFINAAIKLRTDLSPQQLLECCQRLEASHQRTHQYHWGPRTLDIDIILYGEQVIDDEILSIPHPEMHKRDFVLLPLLEIDSELRLPSGQLLKTIALTLNDQTILEKIPSTIGAESHV